MAQRSNMNLGDIVYRSYGIERPGVILKSEEIPGSDDKRLRILWRDGFIEEVDEFWLADYTFARNEHLRKANRMLAIENDLREKARAVD